MGKGENAIDKYFLVTTQCFLPFSNSGKILFDWLYAEEFYLAVYKKMLLLSERINPFPNNKF